MPVDPARLLALELPDHECAWTQRDCQLYALATGFGQDPIDERELRYVFEGPGFQVSPSAAVTLYYDDRWMRESGVDLAMSLHGEQRQLFHRPIPPEGRGRVSSRITGIYDKGPGRGLLVVCEQVLRDARTGEPIATNVITNFARADGGIGYSSGTAPQPHAIPSRPPDAVVEAQTRPEQALLYRLCGDRNPLHADPATARAAGFARPILHGMCTYGFATRAVLQVACDYDASRLIGLGARLTAPVLPGDRVRTDLWLDGDTVSFRTSVPAREAVVLNNGRADVTAAARA
ncbi:MAG TPA: MaoC/PaaZ C-terminal domain-containing protein [Steroidobacteraceae bacterium]|nr:MaoC/PaaZ C-terminal domain-containing protein [Steroidobacteraceae bacterium]